MTLPGISAQDSLYEASGHYYMAGVADRAGWAGPGVMLAGTCTCTDPNCQWSCPSPPTCPTCCIQDCSGCFDIPDPIDRQLCEQSCRESNVRCYRAYRDAPPSCGDPPDC